MSTVHVQIEIAAPPQAVFDTIMDPRRLADWVTIHRSVSNASSPPGVRGATMDQVLQIRGVHFKVHWRLTQVNAPFEAEWQGRGPALSKARIRYQLRGPEEGPTIFEYTNEFHTPGGALGNVASRLVVGSASEREARDSLSRLRELVERG
jgi:carbon monoxide dehydrogenase subunit G